MDRKTYLKRFSCAVRWYLPAAEAGDILADYTDILAQYPEREGAVPVAELGAPFHAARLLAEPKGYGRWLAVFGLLAVCLLALAWPVLPRESTYNYSSVYPLSLFAVGGIAALYWFRPRRDGQGRTPLPKGLLPLLVCLTAAAAAAVAVLTGLSAGVWQALPPGMYGSVAAGTLHAAGLIAAAAGVCGLMKARLSDDRWCALYIMALAVLALCTLVLSVLCSMSLDGSPTFWDIDIAVRLGIVGIAGLAGVGISLCSKRI